MRTIFSVSIKNSTKAPRTFFFIIISSIVLIHSYRSFWDSLFIVSWTWNMRAAHVNSMHEFCNVRTAKLRLIKASQSPKSFPDVLAKPIRCYHVQDHRVIWKVFLFYLIVSLIFLLFLQSEYLNLTLGNSFFKKAFFPKQSIATARFLSSDQRIHRALKRRLQCLAQGYLSQQPSAEVQRVRLTAFFGFFLFPELSSLSFL